MKKRTKQPKETKPRHDPEAIHVVVQEGGSSGEMYCHAFDDAESAREYVSADDSYIKHGPFEIPRPPLEKAAPRMIALLDRLCQRFGDAARNDEPINGADAVEFLAEILPLASEVVGEVRAREDQDRLDAMLEAEER